MTAYPARPLGSVRPRPTTLVAVLAAAAAVLAGCGSHHSAAVAPVPPTSAPAGTVASTSTVPVPAATTTRPPAVNAAVSPLTGLAQPAPARLNRPALVVKIDNINAARPQTGLNQADVVYEEEVEGGLTRLAAVFQSQDADPVGPVRSGRTTDIAIVDDLGHPIFAYSGANARFLAEIRAQPITDVDAEKESPTLYTRDGSRREPDNLYTETTRLYALAPASGPPPSLFQYRPAGQPAGGAGAGPVATAALAWPMASASWTWNAAAGTWARHQNGTVDVDRSGTPVTTTNVVIQFVTYSTDGVATGEGNRYPIPIPKGQLVGSGPVWVLTGGMLIKGTWSRPALGQVTSYTDSAGASILLTPGRTWVELAPSGSVPATTP